ncbi:MAG TPA: response regulator [Pyrinomonadaceae bacterium]|nr:response regulator [Pyrinomonadaceae bacterium]
MNLTAELAALRQQSRDLPIDERAKLSCDLAKRFEKIGEYEKAYDALVEFWPDRTEPPKLEGVSEPEKADVLLRIGALAGWLGATDQIEGGQEKAKDLITQSIELFEKLEEMHRVAEARGELGLCYWREGSYDEARINLKSAGSLLSGDDPELEATLLIRASIVEMRTQKLQEALRYCDKAKPLIEQSEDDALKGSFHVQYGLVFRHLATPENREDYLDRALIEYTAASFHFEQAGNQRYVARVENNLGFLYFTIGRYRDAHQHLDRARSLFIELKDTGTVAQVDETRARTFLAEGRTRDAERLIKTVVRTLKKGGQQALLAEALTTHGTVMARLGSPSRARGLLQRAIEVAETCGDLEGAGRARLSLIEELGNQTPSQELAVIYHEAADLLEKSQDPLASRRLISCGLKTIDSLLAQIDKDAAAPAEGSWEGFSLKTEIRRIERRFIERALRDAGGSVTEASRLLGFKHHQSLISLLDTRLSDLQDVRSKKRRRRRPLLIRPGKGTKQASQADRATAKLSILHVEDHRLVAHLVEELLTEEGIQVDRCANGAAAWEVLKSNAHYDAVVVDNNLPGLSGLELVLRVRSLPRLQNLAIIMLSGDDCEKEAWRAGVNAFLRKPEDLDQLPMTIVRALGGQPRG